MRQAITNCAERYKHLDELYQVLKELEEEPGTSDSKSHMIEDIQYRIKSAHTSIDYWEQQVMKEAFSELVYRVWHGKLEEQTDGTTEAKPEGT